MALSGSFNTNAYDGRYYTLSWTATQNITNNTSTISWTLSCAGGGNWYAERTLNLVIAGQTVYSKTSRVERYAGTIATGSLTLTHDSVGAKSFSASLQVAVYDSAINCTGSGSWALNTIPRKSTLTVANGTLGTAQTIKATRQSTSFTHTITYACGSYSGTLCTKSTTESFSFTPPLAWANGAPNGTSVYVSWKIETFNGSTSIGSNSYSCYMAIPDSVKPTVSFTVADDMGYLSTYGKYVQSKSKLKIAITASGAYSSTISSYKTTADGKTFTDASFVSDVISNSGTLTINVTVTDSRGRTATASKSITVLAYTPPQISAFEVYRCNSSGTASASGAYMAVKFSALVTALDNKNTAAYKVGRKKLADTTYTTETISSLAGVYSVTDSSYIFAADTSSSYDVVLSVTDAFSTTQKQGKGSTASTLISLRAGGKGLAIGKVAEIDNAFEVALETYFRENVNLSKNLTAAGSITATGAITTSGGVTADGSIRAKSSFFDAFGDMVRNGLAAYTGSGTSAIDPNTTTEHVILSDHTNSPPTSGFFYIVTYFYQSKTGDRAQLALPYSSGSMYYRYYYDSAWTDWIRLLSDPVEHTTVAVSKVASDTYLTMNANHMKKQLNQVFGYVYLTTNSAISAGANLIRFPTGSRPAADFYCPLFNYSDGTIAGAGINTNGYLINSVALVKGKAYVANPNFFVS